MEIEKNYNDVCEFKGTRDNPIYGSLNGKFNIGDTVEIIDVGQIYKRYENMYEAMRIPFDRHTIVMNCDIGNVVSRKIHENGDRIIYGIQLSDEQYTVIGERGLKLKKRFLIISIPDSMFELL